MEALHDYVSQCQDNGIDVISEYLFLPLAVHARAVVASVLFSTFAAAKRLHLHL